MYATLYLKFSDYSVTSVLTNRRIYALRLYKIYQKMHILAPDNQKFYESLGYTE